MSDGENNSGDLTDEMVLPEELPQVLEKIAESAHYGIVSPDRLAGLGLVDQVHDDDHQDSDPEQEQQGQGAPLDHGLGYLL